MKYADFEKAQELRNEISQLHDIAATLAPDKYNEEEPVKIRRANFVVESEPVSIPVELAGKLSAMVWELAEKKEKEFEAL